MRLKFKICIVTGGAAGIGKATAQRFAEEGASVIICDVNEEQGHKTAEELGPAVRFVKVNVTDRAAVGAFVDDVVEQYGHVDVLVNNAGVLRDGTLVKVKDGELVKQMSEADFDLVISVNLKGVFNCTQSVVPAMIEQRYGRIVSTSSVVGLYGNFGQTNYVAAKAGVIGMTKVWARELGKYNITANAVAPGFIATEMVKSIPEKVMQHMIEHTPVGRVGQPDDIARAYLFLADERSSFITGAVLSVDGGSVTGT